MQWSDSPAGADRLRCILNALTRVRFVSLEGAMDLKLKGSIDSAPPGWVPWFDHPQRASRDTPVVFGHWSTLGLLRRDDAIGIDTGCVWGGSLTALHWPSRAVTQVKCPGAPALTPGPSPAGAGEGSFSRSPAGAGEGGLSPSPSGRRRGEGACATAPPPAPLPLRGKGSFSPAGAGEASNGPYRQMPRSACHCCASSIGRTG